MEHPDELVADFQEHYALDAYSLGLDGEETTQDIKRASQLLAQLPPRARLVVLEERDNAWSNEAHFLRIIEYDLRAILYALGSGKGEEPQPLPMPSEVESRERSIADAERACDEVLDILKDILPGGEAHG